MVENIISCILLGLCIFIFAQLTIVMILDKKYKRLANRKERIYISGAITNYGYDEALDLFSFAEYCINKNLGDYAVAINPMKLGDEKGKPWIWYIIKDLRILSKCDTIFMLPTWKMSRGAKIERMFAKLTFKKIIYA